MKKIIIILAVLALPASATRAGGADKAAPTAAAHASERQSVKSAAKQLKRYVMDNGLFTCGVPAAWTLERDKEKDAEYKIYEIQLLAPETGKAPTSIFVSYYARDNEDFPGYGDFIERNSRNAAGETRTARETFGPVKKIVLGGRRCFALSRERLVYLRPESKSVESVRLKEKIYVLPAGEGFYVLHFSAPATAFLKHLKTFEQVAGSFKGRP